MGAAVGGPAARLGPRCLQEQGLCSVWSPMRCLGFLQENHYRPPDQDACLPCDCFPHGSHSRTCDADTGQCACKPGVIGRQCNRCDNPFAEVTMLGCEGLCCPLAPLGHVAMTVCWAHVHVHACVCSAHSSALGNSWQPRGLTVHLAFSNLAFQEGLGQSLGPPAPVLTLMGRQEGSSSWQWQACFRGERAESLVHSGGRPCRAELLSFSIPQSSTADVPEHLRPTSGGRRPSLGSQPQCPAPRDPWVSTVARGISSGQEIALRPVAYGIAGQGVRTHSVPY